MSCVFTRPDLCNRHCAEHRQLCCTDAYIPVRSEQMAVLYTLSGTGKELMASDAVRKAYLGG